MPRAMWKGVISFGLVTIPVQLYAAVNRKNVQFHMLDKSGSCRLRRKLYCPETGEEYDFENTARGVEIGPDQYVLFQNDELERLKPESGRTIEIRDFVNLTEIDPIYFDRAYYLTPETGGAKPYGLLLQAMEESSQVGIAKFVMRGNEYLAALRVIGGEVLGLETMYFAEDIRSYTELNIPKVEVDKRELTLAHQLIESLSSEFKPEKYRNEYRERLEAVVAEKAEGKDIVLPEAQKEERGQVLDLMEALKKSIKERDSESAPKSKTKRGSGGKGSTSKGGKKRRAA